MRSNPRAALANPRLLLLVPVAADMAWIYANPPPNRVFNPFFLYLVFFGIGVLLISHLLIPVAVRVRQRLGPTLTFLGLGLALAMVEELVAYLTGSGVFQDTHHPLVFGLVQAGLPLFLWSLGVLLVLRRYAYGTTQLFVLAGLSGWLCEAVIGGLLFRSPVLALLALPVVAYSYFVLIYLPYRAIEGSIRPGRQSSLAAPAALVVPSALWFLGGIAGFFLSRGFA